MSRTGTKKTKSNSQAKQKATSGRSGDGPWKQGQSKQGQSKQGQSTRETSTGGQSDERNRIESLEDLFKAELNQLLTGMRQMIGLLSNLVTTPMSDPLRQTLRIGVVEAIIYASDIETLLPADERREPMLESRAMSGLMKEAAEAANEEGEEEIREIALICVLQRVKHLHIASFGTAAAHARQLGDERTAQILHRLVNDEQRSDQSLTDLCAAIARGANRRLPAADLNWQLKHFFERRIEMSQYTRYRDEDYDRDYDRERGEGRSRGGRSSAQMQERDEYGQFTGYGGGRSGSRSREDYERGGPRGYRGDDYESGRGGGRSRGGRRSAEMQDRDEYGQFAGYGGQSAPRSEREYEGGGYRYEDDDDYMRRSGGRSRGGRRSAEMQDRDEYGQFAGYSGGRYRDEEDDREWRGSSRSRSQRGEDYIGDTGDRDYTREYAQRGPDWRGYEGELQQGRGRQVSRHREDEGYQDWEGSPRSGRRYDEEYTDSAGRHYSRESWERAQQGRARGGQHSHGGRSSR